MSYSIQTLAIGKVEHITKKDKTTHTAISKSAVEKAYLSETGFQGDEQADLVHHGGPDKAVCAYSSEHYPYWEKKLQTKLSPAAFGENVTIAGLFESEIHLGDTFQLGEAIVQVSQPRQPCFKLSLKHNEPKLPLWVRETGYTGFYFRVLQPGWVTTEDKLTFIRSVEGRISIAKVNELLYEKEVNEEEVYAVLRLDVSAESLKEDLEKKLM
nr:MOSC domain-containing protein [Bacillus alkalicellulosilyticus]